MEFDDILDEFNGQAWIAKTTLLALDDLIEYLKSLSVLEMEVVSEVIASMGHIERMLE